MKAIAMKTNLTALTICAALAVVGNGVSAAAPAQSLETETIAGTRMRVEWQRLFSGYKIELPKLPENHTDSLRLGNGDIGVAVYAVPECVVLFVDKNDLLDYRTKPLAHSPEANNRSLAETPMPTTKPENELGRCIGIDLLFQDGSPLRDSAARDLDGIRVHPSQPKGQVGQWKLIEIPIGQWCANRIVRQVVLAFDQPGSKGPFKAVVDDVSIKQE